MSILDLLREQEALTDLLHDLRDERILSMQKNEVLQYQDEARKAYERLSGAEAFAPMQAAMLAEIAEQLRLQNHWLQQIATHLRHMDDLQQVR